MNAIADTQIFEVVLPLGASACAPAAIAALTALPVSRALGAVGLSDPDESAHPAANTPLTRPHTAAIFHIRMFE